MRVLMALCGLVVVSWSAAAGAEKSKAAVLPLTAQRVPEQTAEILGQLLTTELDRAGQYQVIGAADINAMLGLERMKEAVGCSDVACAAEIGGALGVDFLVSGSAARLGKELLVQLTLIDIRASRVLKRGQAAVPDDEGRYREAMEMAVADLLGLARAPKVRAGDPSAPGPKVRIDTGLTDVRFDIELTTSNGATHRCPAPVDVMTPCLLTGLVTGDTRLRVTSPPLAAFTDNFDLDEENEIVLATARKLPGVGSIMMWTFGGVTAATGAALTSIGAATDRGGLTIGGASAVVTGAALLVWGFFLDGRVDVRGLPWF